MTPKYATWPVCGSAARKFSAPRPLMVRQSPQPTGNSTLFSVNFTCAAHGSRAASLATSAAMY